MATTTNNKKAKSRKEELDELVSNESLLTTIDNPFNPFTQWREWFAFDRGKGYNTCNYLARIVRSSDELSPLDEALAIDTAMDEIVRLNPLGIYRKVTKDSFKDISKNVEIPTVTTEQR